MKENIIRDKSFNFAVKVVKVNKQVVKEKKEYVLSKQFLRSGTSVGANVEEAIGAQSEKDFISKMSIAYKEIRETEYWIRLMYAGDYLSQEISSDLMQDCDELKRIISSILLTIKNKSNRNS